MEIRAAWGGFSSETLLSLWLDKKEPTLIFVDHPDSFLSFVCTVFFNRKETFPFLF